MTQIDKRRDIFSQTLLYSWTEVPTQFDILDTIFGPT